MVPGRVLFFSVIGKIIRRRNLGQHPGDDLIGQAVKNLMNTNFQISKLQRMVAQLRHPLLLLILQLLLHLPQHFVNVRHHRPRLSFNTHFHMPPAIHGVHLSAVYARLTLSTDASDDPFSGIGPLPGAIGRYSAITIIPALREDCGKSSRKGAKTPRGIDATYCP